MHCWSGSHRGCYGGPGDAGLSENNQIINIPELHVEYDIFMQLFLYIRLPEMCVHWCGNSFLF